MRAGGGAAPPPPAGRPVRYRLGLFLLLRPADGRDHTMYIPRHFEDSRIEEIHRLIETCPFALDAKAGTQGVLRAHVSPNGSPRRHALHRLAP